MSSHVSSPRAFTLVEVTLALGIAVFCLVVILGLLNVGINTGSASIEQTNATDILSMVASDLRAAPTPSLKSDGTIVAGAPSAVYKLPIPTNGQAATTIGPTSLDATGQVAASAAVARYQLDGRMIPGSGRDPTMVRLMVSWPPTNSAVKSGSVETLVALDRN